MYEIVGILIALIGLAFLIFGGFFASKMVGLLPRIFQISRLAIYNSRFRKAGVAMVMIGAFVAVSQRPLYIP